MTPTEHQQVVDICRLSIHEYFDHYLTDVFPRQNQALFSSHDRDISAHLPLLGVHQKVCRTRRRVDRIMWMIAGVSTLVSVIMTVLTAIYYWGRLP